MQKKSFKLFVYHITLKKNKNISHELKVSWYYTCNWKEVVGRMLRIISKKLGKQKLLKKKVSAKAWMGNLCDNKHEKMLNLISK